MFGMLRSKRGVACASAMSGSNRARTEILSGSFMVRGQKNRMQRPSPVQKARQPECGRRQKASLPGDCPAPYCQRTYRARTVVPRPLERPTMPKHYHACLRAAITLLAILTLTASEADAQANPPGEWRDINGNASSTRYSPLTRSTRRTSSSSRSRGSGRATSRRSISAARRLPRNLPIYANGKLITTAGPKRTVVALDPATRQDALDVPGAGDVPLGSTRCARATARASRTRRSTAAASSTSSRPAFFLHALDAETGKPLAGWGGGVPLKGFPATGSVDLVEGPDQGLGAVDEARASRTTRTSASRSTSATSPTRRRRSS